MRFNNLKIEVFLHIITPVDKPKAFLVAACLNNKEYLRTEASLDELERLADTANIEVAGKFYQSRKFIEKSTYLGKGFLEDLKAKMEMLEVDVLLFDDELAPTQSRNILKHFEIKTIDRTELILDIFHMHAKTKEAFLQIKLAELKYQLPRLKKLWSHLDRERGASGSGKGASRGMGEKQLHIDKRIIEEEIIKISKKLEKISMQHSVRKKQRLKVKNVCLAGYTNAGKSTLFNKLTGSDVFVEDKLFATLTSTAAALDLGKGKEVVLSDTVGFISNLPHNLVASFRSTLKDINTADLIIHVVDIADDMCEENIISVNKVLKEIHADKQPILLVFNKVDSLSEYRVRAEIFEDKYENSVIISAKTGENIDVLLKRIDDLVNESNHYVFHFPFSEQKSVAFLHQYANVLDEKYHDDKIEVKAIVNKSDLRRIEKFIVQEDSE